MARASEFNRKRLLPGHVAETVLDKRAALELALLRSGLTALRRWRNAGDDQACLIWSRRLLDLGPLNVDVVEAVLEATCKVRGPRAARLELAHITQRFLQDVGGVPHALEGWARWLEHP